MSVQFDSALRNAILDLIESNVGTSPTLELRTGQPPANCAAADSGTLIVSIPCPSDWMAAASSGAKALTGTWQANASAASTTHPGHWRLKANGGTVKLQGAMTQSGGLSTAACATTADSTAVTAPANSIPNLSLVTGSGIPTGTYVVSGGGTTSLVLSQKATLTSGSVTLTFTGTVTVQNINIVVGQTVSVTSFDITIPHA
jgi:hypothetical protein